MAYNPYNDISEINRLKNAYNDDRYVKKGTNYNTYAQEAQKYYQNLRDNNLGSLAEELSKADATAAQEILKRYPQSTTAQTVNDLLQPYQHLTNPQYQSTGQDATKNASELTDYLNKLSAPSPVQSQSNTQGLANLQALFDMIGQNNQNINARGSDLWAQMKQFGIDQTGRYEDLYGYIKNTDFLKTPEGKSIMENYKYLGGQAAGDATANAAGSNGGNIDSYSSANANRQQLAYTNAGTAAALGQKNANVGNMLSTLQSLGVDVGDLQNRQLGMYQGDQNYNLGLTGQYTQGQDNVAGQLQAQRDAQNNLVKGGLDYLLGINTNDTARYQSGLNTAGNIATGAMNMAANVNANQTALEQTKLTTETEKVLAGINDALVRYQTDKSEAGKMALQELINKGNTELQRLVNDDKITQYEYEKAIAQIQADAQRYGYDAGITEAGINAKATVDAANVKTGATTTDEFESMSPESRVSYIQDAFSYYLSQGKSVTEARLILNQLYPDYKTMINDIAKEYDKDSTNKNKTIDDILKDLLQ